MKETVVTGFTPRVQVAASERGRSNFTLFVFSGQHGRSFVNTAHGHVWWLEWLVGNCNCDADGANYQLLVATRPRRYQPLVLEELKRDFSVAGWMVVHDSSHICALNLVAFQVHVLVQQQFYDSLWFFLCYVTVRSTLYGLYYLKLQFRSLFSFLFRLRKESRPWSFAHKRTTTAKRVTRVLRV